MAKLIYAVIASLDGYIADEGGTFDWAVPDAEVHAFINDQQRSVGTYLYGRRMYETMLGWETDPTLAAQSPLLRDFAQLWQAAERMATPAWGGIYWREEWQAFLQAQGYQRFNERAMIKVL